MNRTTQLGIALCLVLLATCLAGTAAAEQQISVEEVTVSPEQPAPGESVTVQTTIQNTDTESIEVDRVTVYDPDEDEYRATVDDVDTIQAGDTTELALVASFEDTGTQSLRLVTETEKNGSTTTTSHPFTVTVVDVEPRLLVDVPDRIAVGAATDVNVTVINTNSRTLQDLDLEVSGRILSVEPEVQVLPRLEPGEEVQRSFTVEPQEDDNAILRTTLGYKTSTGHEASFTETDRFETEAPVDDVVVSADVVGEDDSTFEVQISNFGNAPAEDLEILVENEDEELARTTTSPVQPGDQRTVSEGLPADVRGEISVTVDYALAGEDSHASAAIEHRTNPAEITLTGVDFDDEMDHVRITGSAANVGGTHAEGVMLEVQSTESVRAVSPNRDYFVGELRASDFARFDLTVQVEEEAAAVPIEVSYDDGGERQTEVIEVHLDDGESEFEVTEAEASRPLLWGIGALVGLSVIGIMAYGVYNSRN